LEKRFYGISMKPRRKMLIDGTKVFTRFRKAMKSVPAVPRAEERLFIFGRDPLFYLRSSAFISG
jgi:hypothetical protein